MPKTNLRKVLFLTADSKGKYIVSNKGYFHEWGKEIEDNGETQCEFSIGIIEAHDGICHSVIPSRIAFEDWKDEHFS